MNNSEKSKAQARELTILNEQARRRNLELDALHYVWCDGGCASGTHRFDGKGPDFITEEIVAAAEQNTKRLRTWFENRKIRKARYGEV